VTDRQNYDSQDRASIAASRGKNYGGGNNQLTQVYLQNGVKLVCFFLLKFVVSNITSGQSNLSKRPHRRPPYTDGSIVFARLRHLVHASLDLPESTTQTASRSIQPFLPRDAAMLARSWESYVLCPPVCLSHACFVTNPKKLPAIFFIPHERAILLLF